MRTACVRKLCRTEVDVLNVDIWVARLSAGSRGETWGSADIVQGVEVREGAVLT